MIIQKLPDQVFNDRQGSQVLINKINELIEEVNKLQLQNISQVNGINERLAQLSFTLDE